MSELTIPTKDGQSFQAYVAMPEVTPAPAIIMIQEIFGVNEEMRKKCDDLAAKGYIAVCPDLFWRLEPGVQLTDKTEEEWAKAFDLFNRFDIDLGVEDLRATHHVFKGHAQSTSKVGCIGYCLGGKLAYLMATRSNIDLAIGYYGVEIDKFIDEAQNIKAPLMLHIAEEDKFVNKEAQAKIIEGLKDNSFVTIHSYAGVNHAFSRINGEHFDADAAELANQRTFDFISDNLELQKAA